MTGNEVKLKCYEHLREELKKKDIEAVMRGDNWKQLMCLMADTFNTIAAKAESESDVATNIDAEILALSHNVLEPSGVKGFELKKEHKVVIEKSRPIDPDGVYRSQADGSVGRNGRIDSKYASVVIEYKQPSTYKNKADTDKAYFQELEYLNSLFEENDGTYLGIVTDGKRCQFVLFNEHVKKIYDSDIRMVHPETDVCKLNASMVDRMIRSIINLQVKALNSENLISDLVKEEKSGKNVIFHLTASLYNSLSTMDSITSVSYGLLLASN